MIFIATVLPLSVHDVPKTVVLVFLKPLTIEVFGMTTPSVKSVAGGIGEWGFKCGQLKHV